MSLTELYVPQEDFGSSLVVITSVEGTSRIRIFIGCTHINHSPIVVNILIFISLGIHEVSNYTGYFRGVVVSVLQHT
jgi:hypothetical protein